MMRSDTHQADTTGWRQDLQIARGMRATNTTLQLLRCNWREEDTIEHRSHHGCDVILPEPALMQMLIHTLMMIQLMQLIHPDLFPNKRDPPAHALAAEALPQSLELSTVPRQWR
jgi:hypothetical protein